MKKKQEEIQELEHQKKENKASNAWAVLHNREEEIRNNISVMSMV